MLSHASTTSAPLPSLRTRAVIGLAAWVLASACGGGPDDDGSGSAVATEAGSSGGADTDPSTSGADTTAADTDAGSSEGAGSEASEGSTGAELPLPTVDELAGDWVSPNGCEVPPGQMGTSVSRVFSFTAAGEFSFAFTLSGGETCEAPLFDVQVDGTYTLGGPSAVPGAIEADFVLASTVVTPTEAGVAALQMMCPAVDWVAGETVDISDGACVGFPIPVPATCAQEYDIAAIDEEERLIFGAREQGICTPENRPTMLNTNWLVRG